MNFRSGRLRQLRYLRRYREIMRILAKHGFAQVLVRLRLYGFWERIFSLGQKKGAAAPPDLESGLRAALEELGPAFIKLGQLLSTRADLLPRSYIEELSRLQDQVPPFSPAKAQELLAAELKANRAQEFADFQMEPLAAASIGQVHRAVLHSGEEVVVKIKRPGVDRRLPLTFLQRGFL
jgi:ubiquinone biosynthesis protein